MFKIYDGREHFYQWDSDRKLIVEDASITEVHFCNRTDDCSLVCETYVEDGVTLVNVPNILLQNDWCIRVYAFDGSYTKHEKRYDVITRSKPADYVYTETELKNYDELLNRIDEIEKNGISDEAVATAVETYLDEHDIQVDLTGYATEAYVDEAIGNLDVDVDLTDYYTKSETDNLIETIELTPGEKGEPGADGKDGKNGVDGISATHSWYGTVLSISSASGTSSADLQGVQGEPGKDGADGEPGKDGYTPVRGVDYWTAEDKAEIIAEASDIDLDGYVTDDELTTTLSKYQKTADFNSYMYGVENQIAQNTTNINTKANSADVYTKTEIDNKLVNLDGGDVDLTNYITKDYAANNYVPLSGGVLSGNLDATKYYINGVSFSAVDKVNNTLSIGSSTYSARVASKDKPQWFKDGKAQGTFAMVSDIPSLENYATKTYVDEVLGVIENGTY